MKFILAFSLMLLLPSLTAGQDRTEYIERYKSIAIQEMERTGIPASIKLAQAILESGAGGSDLARRGNNHFGIKCGNAWRGKKYMQKDDDHNGRGKLVKSCFREFSDPEESFIAHSDFLTDPAKSHRYGFLFDYDHADYKAWAHGLKKAGYATNPKYPDLLIRIIKDHKLYEFDQIAYQEGWLARARDKKDDRMAEDWLSEDKYVNEGGSSFNHRPELYNNDVKFVFAQAGDRVFDIAQATEIPAWRIIAYNEHLQAESQELEAGRRVYLQKKRKKFRGRQKFHMVRNGEDMEEIAQKYAIKLDALYNRNQMHSNMEPAEGQKIFLRGRRKEAPAMRTRELAGEPPKSKKLDLQDPPEDTESSPYMTGSNELKEGQITANTTTRFLVQPEYIVQKGDTLYNIARMHGLHLDDLKKMNNLAGDTIHPGQKIRLAH